MTFRVIKATEESYYRNDDDGKSAIIPWRIKWPHKDGYEIDISPESVILFCRYWRDKKQLAVPAQILGVDSSMVLNWSLKTNTLVPSKDVGFHLLTYLLAQKDSRVSTKLRSGCAKKFVTLPVGAGN